MSSFVSSLGPLPRVRPGAALRFCAGVAQVLIVAAVSLAALGRAGATEPAARFVTPGEMRSGALLLRSGDARHVEAPRLDTDIDLVVSGPTARARVTQVFRNPTAEWVEAVYVYPLPDGAAVDSLGMMVGERAVVGEIRERRQARVDYEQARAAGAKAALLEQERPNLFTSQIANIGPGETVVVQIEYQEPVRQSGGEFSLRVPLVVAPRYSPAPVAHGVDFRPDPNGLGDASDPVPDRRRIEPPVLDPRRDPRVNPVSISVRLQAGFPLGEVSSHHHPVRLDAPADDIRLITLGGGVVPADRDFELSWRPAKSTVPSIGLFRERVGNSEYLLALITPPALTDDSPPKPREVVFVIDNSGSMGGTSMQQAKASLIYALGRLTPADRFNVIRFDDSMDVLFPDAVPADDKHVAAAKAFVSALQARGGTEMLAPLRAALSDLRPGDTGTLRQLVFLTDGAIGNEQQLLDMIAARRGRSRVFMVGIGSAPNSFLMSRAAELGRGTFTHIGSAEQVDARMRALFDKLESPAVTQLHATLPGGQADVTPGMLPDLYRGETVVLAAKAASLTGTFEVTGMIGERRWSASAPVAAAAAGVGVSKLWARRKIADAEIDRTLRRLDPDAADKAVLALALEHHLVSRLTSLVAVEATPERAPGVRLTRADVPLNLPAGWDFDALFGGERPGMPDVQPAPTRRAQDETRRLAQANGPQPAVDRAARPVVTPAVAAGVSLPATATDAELRLLLGLGLLAASLLLIAACRLCRPRAAA